MLFSNPVPGVIHVGAEFYPTAPGAWWRPAGNHDFVVTQGFGPSDLSVEPTVTFVQDGDEYDIYGHLIPAGTYDDFHTGIDLANGRGGDPVRAAGTGTVESAGTDSSGARFIVINHGTVDGHVFRTQYWHEGTVSVAKGARVVDQQQIGTVGNSGASSGTSTGYHVHFGVTIDGHAVDPWRRLKQNVPEDEMFNAKAVGSIGTFVLGVGHQLISPADWTKHFGPYPNPLTVNVVASLNLTDANGVPMDIDGHKPPQNHRDEVYMVDAPTFKQCALALRQDGTFTAAPDPLVAELEGRINAAKVALG